MDQVIGYCLVTPSHYLNQCWPRWLCWLTRGTVSKKSQSCDLEFIEQTESFSHFFKDVMNRLESKQQNVEAELAEGEMLMKEEHVPAFLEGAVQSLQQHWHHTEELANQRYNMLKVSYHMEVWPLSH